jgi:hypothetical protein
MPARSGEPLSPQSPEKGGRRTSREGGNRGECCGGWSELHSYGDLKNRSAIYCREHGDQLTDDTAHVAGANADAPTFSMMRWPVARGLAP